MSGARPAALVGATVLCLVSGVAACRAGAASPAPAPGDAPVTEQESARVLARVLDTESSLGPLAAESREVTLGDLIRFHGHPCDGLVAAAGGIALGLRSLFPEGPVDRTDVVAVTNASPCYSDAAAYLTGARVLYGTVVVDRELGDSWVLLRRSTGRAVRVRLKVGVKPAELPTLETKLRADGCDTAAIDRVQGLQSSFIRRLLTSAPEDLYDVETLGSFPYTVAGTRPDAAKAGCPRAGDPEKASP